MKLCHNKHYEREYADMKCAQGNHCERIAGSGSAQQAVCDCILFQHGKSYLVEVKTTKEKAFYVRKHIKEQLSLMNEMARKQGILTILAIKYKYRGWKEIEIIENIPQVILW